MSLQEICQPIEADLQEFETAFKTNLTSDIFLLDEVIDYVLAHKGKRLRPILVFLTCRLNGQVTKETFKAATIVELLHTATLLHDDVVDESNLRRGVPTINSIWKNKVAILTGDYLFSKALTSMVELKNQKVYQVLASATQRMSQGELLQIERDRDYQMEEAVYFRLISDKTASLISVSCQLGAITAAHNNGQNVEIMKEFGENLGLAFQIKDDLLDYTGNESVMGKPTGKDIIENKITLPLLYSLKRSDRKAAQQIIQIFERGVTADDIEEISSFVKKNGGLAYASQKAQFYSQRACQYLQNYEPSPYKASLIALVDFITTRER
ncbi:MAG: polyprenyl synthetase family protein [candidate division KSB1 bacterium]|nr:polyprenyl synthetase family protein [candidate division KSB1 bacterium]